MGEDVSALKLVKSIEENTKHYVEILSRAIDDCMPQPTSEVTYVHFLGQRREIYQVFFIDSSIASRMTSWTF